MAVACSACCRCARLPLCMLPLCVATAVAVRAAAVRCSLCALSPMPPLPALLRPQPPAPRTGPMGMGASALLNLGAAMLRLHPPPSVPAAVLQAGSNLEDGAALKQVGKKTGAATWGALEGSWEAPAGNRFSVPHSAALRAHTSPPLCCPSIHRRHIPPMWPPWLSLLATSPPSSRGGRHVLACAGTAAATTLLAHVL